MTDFTLIILKISDVQQLSKWKTVFLNQLIELLFVNMKLFWTMSSALQIVMVV